MFSYRFNVFSVVFAGFLSFLLRFWAFSQTRYANGWDAYFYLIQVKSQVTEGRMHSEDASLIYGLLRGMLWLTGGDYVLMYQCTAALLAGLFTIATGFWRNRAAGWLLLAWSVFSPHLTYFAAQYPKNLLGLVLLLFFMGSLNALKNSAKDHNLPDSIRHSNFLKLVWPLTLLLLNYFGHRFTFVLAVWYGVLWWFFRYRAADWAALLRWDGRAVKRLLAGGWWWLILVAVLLLLLWFAVAFPGLFHWYDLGRLSGVLSARPQVAPWSFVQAFGTSRISGWWLAEVAAITALFSTQLIRFFTRRSAMRLQWGLLFFLLPLIFPFLEWSFTGIAYRAFLVWVLLCPLLLIPSDLKFEKAGAWCLLAAAFFSWKSYVPSLHDPDYARFERITNDIVRYFEQQPASESRALPELLICHNALAEFYTFTTGADALPWQPEYEIKPGQLWRLSANVLPQTLRYYTGNALEIKVINQQYSLLPESLWQQVLQKAAIEQDTILLNNAHSWYNPHKIRPGWLLKK